MSKPSENYSHGLKMSFEKSLKEKEPEEISLLKQKITKRIDSIIKTAKSETLQKLDSVLAKFQRQEKARAGSQSVPRRDDDKSR